MKTLTVNLGDRSYPIYIGVELLQDPALIQKHIQTKAVCIVSNTTVSKLYLSELKKSLNGYRVIEVILEDGEQFKNADSLNQIYTVLLDSKFNRDSTIIALGGGVVGDIAGFAAASFMRGIPFLQIPTTLLSQVDSSVGGKTGINHPLGKNMIGAFYQPQAVIIDMHVLQTLDKREISAGLAEVIKYGLIWDQDFFDHLENHIEDLKNLNVMQLEQAIYRSCEIKAEVVSQDERESGLRAILNLGHTFGHAIENCLGYGEWLHGEAVGCGMVMAAQMSLAHGWINDTDFDRIRKLIQAADLPIEKPQISLHDFLAAMSLDKKNKNQDIYLVLQQGIGKAIVTKDYSFSELEKVLN
ncbi:MAG: 3-dehydroquinate synthase [Methylophilaceae bacterium]